MALHNLLIVKILLLIILCLIGLQYLSLLQVNEKRPHVNRSLFTLDWGDPSAVSLGGNKLDTKYPAYDIYLRYCFISGSSDDSGGGSLVGGGGGLDINHRRPLLSSIEAFLRGGNEQKNAPKKKNDNKNDENSHQHKVSLGVLK